MLTWPVNNCELFLFRQENKTKQKQKTTHREIVLTQKLKKSFSPNKHKRLDSISSLPWCEPRVMLPHLVRKANSENIPL